MDESFNPDIKPGAKLEPFKNKWKDEGRIDKKTYKVAKPDIEHIEHDNINPDELTSDSSEDE